MAYHSSTARSASFKHGGVAGRSAATGHDVLKPASKKGSSITLKEASRAAKDIQGKSK
jgi:hypothetical protein